MAIISSLEKEEAGEAEEVYNKFEKDTGKVPEWVKVMAHNPKVVKEFTELFKVIMDEGYIAPLLRWKIAYTVSQTLKCPFCVDVTEKMLKSLGAGDEVIEKVKGKEGLEEGEKEVLKLVEKVTKTAQCDTELFRKLKEKFSEPELVEIVSIIGLFNYINRFNNAFCILPE
jgi:uncharacterized peroxidase-related enzyme